MIKSRDAFLFLENDRHAAAQGGGITRRALPDETAGDCPAACRRRDEGSPAFSHNTLSGREARPLSVSLPDHANRAGPMLGKGPFFQRPDGRRRRSSFDLEELLY